MVTSTKPIAAMSLVRSMRRRAELPHAKLTFRKPSIPRNSQAKQYILTHTCPSRHDTSTVGRRLHTCTAHHVMTAIIARIIVFQFISPFFTDRKLHSPN